MTNHPLALTSFRRWMSQMGKSPTTIRTYLSQARSVLQTPENAHRLASGPIEGWHRAILLQDEACSAQARKVFRAAMRAFDAWTISVGKPSILPMFPDHRDPFAGAHAIAPALASIAMRGDAPWKRFPHLKWAHVQAKTEDMFIISDPGWQRTYRIPRDAMLQVYTWAKGATGEITREHPLIPREPLSLSPMPIGILRRLACAAGAP